MQVKVIIGTIAFMLTMIVMGFAALREPARLQAYTAAFQGRSVENGARLYQDNCSNCHGENGKAEECYDPGSGKPIGCVGLPLNNGPLLCGDRSQRMDVLGWDGSKRSFIESTISSGRYGTIMPTWSSRFGGPMRDDQIFDLSSFVLNWESDELCSTPVIVFDWPEAVEEFRGLEEIAEGDAARGAELYVAPYGCSGCHGFVDQPGSNAVGPWLGEIADVGATRIDGYTADQYLFESILDPNAYVVEECPTGPCGVPSAMAPNNFAVRMGASPQDLADLIAFLLGK